MDIFSLHNSLNIIILVFAPLITGLIIFLGTFRNNFIIIRRFAKWFSLFYLIYCAAFLINYNTNLQFDYNAAINFNLISQINSKAQFAQGILSSLFCTLTALISLICLIGAKSTVANKHRLFYSFVLFLETSVMGIFCAQDLYTLAIAISFEIFCTYILVSNFSIPRPDKYIKTYVLLNFSGLMLFFAASALICASFHNNIFDLNIPNLINSAHSLNPLIQLLSFFALFFLCAPRIPVFGFHKPICEIIKNINPSAFCTITAQVITGIFIFIKFNFYTLGEIFEIFAPAIAILGIINICYFGILALREPDIKKSFAYCYFSQSGTALAALASISPDGLCGAVFITISNTLIFCGLFYCYSFISQKFKTQKLPFMGGLVTKTPKLGAAAFFLTLAAAGIPLTSGFTGKILCVLGGFSTQLNSPVTIWTSTFFIMAGFILGALYVIKVFQQVFFGPDILLKAKVNDILRHQVLIFCIIAVVCIYLSAMPHTISDALTKYSDMIISSFSI